MRLTEMERLIKKMISEGEEGDDLYKMIFQLSKSYLLRHRLFNTPEDYEEVAELMATDLYLTRHNISSWIGYIKASRQRFITEWRKKYKIQIIEPKGRQTLIDSVIRMSCGSSIEYEQQEGEKIFPDFAKGIPVTIKKALELSRYYPDTPEYLNAHLSLLLSVANKRYISFGQTEENENYTRMLYRAINDEISEELYSETDDSRCDIMRIFALEDFKEQADEIGRVGISL